MRQFLAMRRYAELPFADCAVQLLCHFWGYGDEVLIKSGEITNYVPEVQEGFLVLIADAVAQ